METETCTSTCQLCGRDSPHDHSPEEIIIYGNGRKNGIAAAQQQAAQAVADDVVRDAERYRWMRDVTGEVSADALIDALEQCGEEFDKAIDAAIAASQKKEGV